VHERLNIVVAGGTSTGKTTLANALLDEIAHTRDRVLILEDTVELQCRSDDHVGMRAEPGVAPWPTWCAPRCACGPTASSWARCVAPKHWTCSRPGARGTQGGIATVHAGSAAAHSRGWSNWCRRSV
jgi:hypothetical protein